MCTLTNMGNKRSLPSKPHARASSVSKNNQSDLLGVDTIKVFLNGIIQRIAGNRPMSGS